MSKPESAMTYSSYAAAGTVLIVCVSCRRTDLYQCEWEGMKGIPYLKLI